MFSLESYILISNTRQLAKFRDSVSIVTGAASGLGLAIAKQLHSLGSTVVMADIDLPAVHRESKAIDHELTRAIPMQLDVANKCQFELLLEQVKDRFGAVHFLFNNAGINRMGELRQIGWSDWQDITNVNLWGVVHGTCAAYRMMIDQGFGHIVNIASGLGITPAPRNIPYAMSKAAVVALSESLRIEGYDLGVHVSVVCPGWIETPMLDAQAISGKPRSDSLSIKRIASHLPFGLMDVEKAAAKILTGISRGHHYIVFPRYVRIFRWLYQHFSFFTDMWSRSEIRAYRQAVTDVHDAPAIELRARIDQEPITAHEAAPPPTVAYHS